MLKYRHQCAGKGYQDAPGIRLRSTAKLRVGLPVYFGHHGLRMMCFEPTKPSQRTLPIQPFCDLSPCVAQGTCRDRGRELNGLSEEMLKALCHTIHHFTY
jgi:hypothetical protein